MKKVYSFLVNKHQEILRYLLILLTSILITNWLPKTAKFKYEYEKGRPWKHESLMAPFDFAIKKSTEEIEAEKAQLLSDFYPYYQQIDLAAAKGEGFKKDYQKNYHSLRNDSSFLKNIKRNYLSRYSRKPDSIRHYEFGKGLLDDLYDKGIINLSEQHQALSPDDYINVLQGNIAGQKRIRDYISIEQAYRYIIDTLKNSGSAFMIPILENAITYNIVYDDSITQRIKDELIENISLTRGLIQEGEMIIAKGNIVTEEKFEIIESLKEEYEEKIEEVNKGYLITIGYFLITIIAIILLSIFIIYFEPEVHSSLGKNAFILLLITLFTGLSSLAVELDVPSYYVLPFCIVPIIVRTFFGSRLALFVHILVVVISGFIVPIGIPFIFIHLVAGIIAIFTNEKTHYWSQFFISIGFIFVTYTVSYFAVSLLQEGNFKDIEWIHFGWIAVNVFLTLLAYPLIPIFEKVFGFISAITLVELGDLNKKLLKDLSFKAPGTFQHSLQVANLAEAAAYEIDADTLMVRVGSLYHDIGKMEKPQYFIENQSSEVNPHDELPFEESARIIIDHVSKGVEMAKKAQLPDVLIDFIRTHHGTSRVEYFYQSYLKNYPEHKVEEELFRYPGPLPYSKETALVMIADTVEAASRSLKNPTAADIDQLVEKLTDQKIRQQQFIHCNLTFRDITTIKKIFKKMLNSIHHVRVAYPE